MSTDAVVLVIAIAIVLGLVIAALAVLWRDRRHAQEAARTVALVQLRASEEAARKIAHDVAREFSETATATLREDMQDRFRDVDAHLGVLYARETSLPPLQDSELDKLRAQLRATLEAADRQLAEMSERLNVLETETRDAVARNEKRLNVLAESFEEQMATGRERTLAVEHAAERQLTAARAEMAAIREGGVPQAAPITESTGGLSGAQVQAIAHVYWELEALHDTARANITTLSGTDEQSLSPEDADLIRTMPPLPVEPMRLEIEVLGADATLQLDTVVAHLDRLEAGRGKPDTNGNLRHLLQILIEDVQTLLTQLEGFTGAF